MTRLEWQNYEWLVELSGLGMVREEFLTGWFERSGRFIKKLEPLHLEEMWPKALHFQ
jgi:hypothetical protein